MKTLQEMLLFNKSTVLCSVNVAVCVLSEIGSNRQEQKKQDINARTCNATQLDQAVPLLNFHDKTNAYLWRSVLQTLQQTVQQSCNFLAAIHIISLDSKRDGYRTISPQTLL